MEMKMLMLQRMETNAKENFCTIDGKEYATGDGGRGLYELVDPESARFYREAVLIDEDFRLGRHYDVEKAMRKAICKAEMKELS